MSLHDASRVPSGLIQPLVSPPVAAPLHVAEEVAQVDESAPLAQNTKERTRRKTSPRVAAPIKEATTTLQIVLPVSLARALHVESAKRQQTRSAMVAHALRQQFPALRVGEQAA